MAGGYKTPRTVNEAARGGPYGGFRELLKAYGGDLYDAFMYPGKVARGEAQVFDDSGHVSDDAIKQAFGLAGNVTMGNIPMGRAAGGMAPAPVRKELPGTVLEPIVPGVDITTLSPTAQHMIKAIKNNGEDIYKFIDDAIATGNYGSPLYPEELELIKHFKPDADVSKYNTYAYEDAPSIHNPDYDPPPTEVQAYLDQWEPIPEPSTHIKGDDYIPSYAGSNWAQQKQPEPYTIPDDLPMDEASRNARRIEQGYNIPVYRGRRQANPEETPRTVRVPQDGERAIFTFPEEYRTNTEHYAGGIGDRGQTQAMYGRMERPLVVDWKNVAEPGMGEQYNSYDMTKLIDRARAQGHDGIQINGIRDVGGPQSQYLFFEPDQLRSRFAKFDPRNLGSGDLLGGIATSALLAQFLQEQDEWRK